MSQVSRCDSKGFHESCSARAHDHAGSLIEDPRVAFSAAVGAEIDEELGFIWRGYLFLVVLIRIGSFACKRAAAGSDIVHTRLQVPVELPFRCAVHERLGTYVRKV